MYKIEVHNRVNQMISFYYDTKLWPDRNRFDLCKWLLGVLLVSSCVYYPIGLLVTSLSSDNKSESIFMGISSVIASVELIRIYYFYWKKDQIIELVLTLGSHVIRNKDLHKLYLEINTKINRFLDFGSLLVLMMFTESIIVLISALPCISNEKHLPLNIYFPLNWKENEIVYWFAFGFIMYDIMWLCICSILNVIIWYLMMSCGIKYEILGNEMKLMGVDSIMKPTVMKRQQLFLEELLELIKNHRQLQDITAKFQKTFSDLFFIQIITSGLSICGSVFALAFFSIENPLEYVMYALAILYIAFEIFVVTYFGNEIKLWSSRLSYYLFECNWLDQSESCKQCIIILMEVLKRPQVLIIRKLYPLDLQIFTKILNFAYSLFNVLMNFK